MKLKLRVHELVCHWNDGMCVSQKVTPFYWKIELLSTGFNVLI